MKKNKKEAKGENKEIRKIYFLPKTKLGKISFWLVIAGVIIMYGLYWSSMLIDANNTICDNEGICQSTPGSLSANQGFILLTRILPSLLASLCIILAGIASIVSIIKYKDYAISLFISSLIGLIGILFVLGEFLVAH